MQYAQPFGKPQQFTRLQKMRSILRPACQPRLRLRVGLIDQQPARPDRLENFGSALL